MEVLLIQDMPNDQKNYKNGQILTYELWNINYLLKISIPGPWQTNARAKQSSHQKT
jgi:hypothetical protein